MNNISYIIIYRLFLDFIYSNWIAEYYEYYGFKQEVTSFSFLLSIFLLSIGTAFIRNNNKASSVILNFIMFMYFIPFTTMVAYNAFDDSMYIFYYMVYWMCLVFYARFLNVNIRFVQIKERYISDKNKRYIMYFISGLMLLNILFITIFYTGINLSFNLYDIYAIRSNINFGNIPTICFYLLIGSKLFVPIIFYYYYYENNKIGMFLMFVLGVLCFSALALKAVAFVELCVILLILLEKYIKRYQLYFYAMLLSGISALEVIIGEVYYITELVIRRVCFITNLLSYDYYLYFSVNEPDYFRSSFLRWFGFESSFKDLSVVRTIGKEFLHSEELAANNGLLADVFTNTGYAGLIIMPAVIVLLLKIIDFSTNGLPFVVLLLPCLIISMDLVDTFLTVSLLTHGILFSLFILKLIPRQKT